MRRVLMAGMVVGTAMGPGVPFASAQMCWWPYAAAAREMVGADADDVAPPLPAAGVVSPGPVALLAAGDVKSAEDLLAALELADQGLVSLTAEVLYDKVQVLMGDRQTRFGRLAFVNDARAAGIATGAGGGKRKFAIEFDRMVAGDVERAIGQAYVFDGEWLIERDSAEKLITRTRLVEPGEEFDPLRVGSGPLPIPIGQKRAEILSRYDARLAPVEEGLQVDGVPEGEVATLKAFVVGCTQIRLTPRAERAGEDELTDVRLWYRATAGGRWLPRLARAVNSAGDVSTVQLINVETQDVGGAENAAARPPEGWFAVEAEAGWRVEVRESRRRP